MPVRALACVVAVISVVAMACMPPAAPSPTATPPTASRAASPAVAASPGASPSPPASPPVTPSPAAAVPAAPKPSGLEAGSCKVAQLYYSPTSDKGWSWSHEQSFLSIQQELAYVDLTIRKDSVPDDNKQAVEAVLESMVQQGAHVVYTTSFGYLEPTRAVAARHPDVAFFQVSGLPGPSDPPNIGYYFATIEEARFITGEVAGLVVEPGANLGYVAPFPIPEVFRGENAFALGVMETNPAAKVHNKWTLTWFHPSLEKAAAEALLGDPVRASLIAHHQDSTATQLAAQSAGKWGIAYHANMNDAAPKATLTAATWNWTVHNKPTVEAACAGAWTQDGKVTIPKEYTSWRGSMKDGTIGVAPLNAEALADHPRRSEIQKLYDDEVAKFKSGEKNLETIFAGPIKDNTGQVKIQGKPDIGKLYDENGLWFVENVVGAPRP